ncbi:MAG: 4Fe-4S binding protein [Mediterraneibacter faecis]
MNASIDENLCVNCGACEKVCPNNSVLQMKRPQEWYQGWVDATRQTSPHK